MSILRERDLEDPTLDFDGGGVALFEVTHLSVAKVDRFSEWSVVRGKSSFAVGESARDDLTCRGGSPCFSI